MDLVIKKAVIYCRVSTVEQATNFSLENQEKACTDKATSLNYEIVKRFYDKGESAKTTDRPGFQEMLSYCSNKKNKIDAVIVYHSSRFSRNVLDFLLCKRDLADHGVVIISTTEVNIEQDNPESHLISTVLSSISQYENENKARMVVNGMKRRFMEGYFLRLPLGYKSAVIDGKTVAVIDENTAPIIKNMFVRIAKERLTLAQVTRELNKTGIRKFCKQSVKKLFTNKFYIGIPQSRIYGDSPVRGKHEILIGDELFYTVQAIIDNKPLQKAARTHLRDDYPLRGILRCPVCNTRMTSAWSKGKNKRYGYYICNSKGHRINISAKKAEDIFLEFLSTLRFTPKFVNFYTEILKAKYEERYKQLLLSRHLIKKDQEDYDKLLNILRYKHLKGIYSDEEYTAMKEELNTKKYSQSTLLPEKKMDIRDIEATINFMKFYLCNIDSLFLRANAEGRHAIGCSIYPLGVVFEKESYRTPQLGLEYKEMKQLAASQYYSVPLG